MNKKLIICGLMLSVLMIVGCTTTPKNISESSLVSPFENLPGIEKFVLPSVSTTRYYDCASGEGDYVSENLYQPAKPISSVKIVLWGIMTNGQPVCSNKPATDFYATVSCSAPYTQVIGTLHFDSTYTGTLRDAKPAEYSFSIVPRLEQIFTFPQACSVIKLNGRINRHYQHGNWLEVYAYTLPYTYSAKRSTEDIKGATSIGC